MPHYCPEHNKVWAFSGDRILKCFYDAPPAYPRFHPTQYSHDHTCNSECKESAQERKRRLLQERRINGICTACGKRRATEKFAEGAIALTHGAYEMLCEGCVDS